MSYNNEKLEEFERYIKGKKVAIIGLGISNIPLLSYLYSLECTVSVFDKREIEKLDSKAVKEIKQYNFNLYCGPDSMKNLKNFDVIFRSPSCRPDTKEILEEVQNGAVLTSEIEMLMQTCPATIIGITGSDGKTTTTNLIYHILKESGYNCYLGGNIGIPLFTKVKEMKKEDMVVLELSSFQLMDMQISPHISVITNISPNHLDIHKSYEEYIDAKKNIFKYQASNDILVINQDNEITKEFAKEAKGNVKSCDNKLRRHILNTNDILLRGVHNHENICSAIAATASLVQPEIQAEAIRKFKGVEHRLEFIRQINDVKWYNDSIGTSPSRTIAGLNSFSEKIVLIAGGYDKHLDYEPIAKPIVDNVSKLILIGATAPKIQEAVEKELSKQEKEIPIYNCTTLKQTVEKAKEVASASFDMFKNFEERGNIFKELVNNI